ncbi:hypothetical protein KM043_013736 [Ampulex compressa]|nr:hypothetical protein KM043_013736 [Ampulex compressa]
MFGAEGTACSPRRDESGAISPRREGRTGRRRDGDGPMGSSRWERRVRGVDRRCKEARASPVSAHGYRRWRAGASSGGRGLRESTGTETWLLLSCVRHAHYSAVISEWWLSKLAPVWFVAEGIIASESDFPGASGLYPTLFLGGEALKRVRSALGA